MRLFRRITATTLLVLVGAAPAVHAQGGGVTVSGRVTNTAGAPLPGASVFLQGLSIGSQTNEQGRYTIRAVPTRCVSSSDSSATFGKMSVRYLLLQATKRSSLSYSENASEILSNATERRRRASARPVSISA